VPFVLAEKELVQQVRKRELWKLCTNVCDQESTSGRGFHKMGINVGGNTATKASKVQLFAGTKKLVCFCKYLFVSSIS
jgi:hypothetical protein